MHKTLPFVFSLAIAMLFQSMACSALYGQSPAQKKKVVIGVEVYKGDNYIYMKDVAAFYGMNYSASGKYVSFKSKYSNISFTVNSKLMYLNGVQIYMSRPVILLKGNYLMGKSDMMKLLEPILRPQTIKKAKKVKNILIDPGHGGTDVGTLSGNDFEKDINLQVALRLANKLKAKGFNVFMTRNKDNRIELEQRVAFSNKIAADLFVSIHCNATADKNVNGLETYITPPVGDAPVDKPDIFNRKCAASAFDEPSAYLAYYTQRSILQKTGCNDRGLRRKSLHVIRNANCPSMLIEMGFFSNKAELANLKNAQKQEQYAEAIVDSITRYNNISK